jgi:hypothetical protein
LYSKEEDADNVEEFDFLRDYSFGLVDADTEARTYAIRMDSLGGAAFYKPLPKTLRLSRKGGVSVSVISHSYSFCLCFCTAECMLTSFWCKTQVRMANHSRPNVIRVSKRTKTRQEKDDDVAKVADLLQGDEEYARELCRDEDEEGEDAMDAD